MRRETGRELVAKEGGEEIKERQRERGRGAVEGYLLVFSLVLIPFCA